MIKICVLIYHEAFYSKNYFIVYKYAPQKGRNNDITILAMLNMH